MGLRPQFYMLFAGFVEFNITFVLLSSASSFSRIIALVFQSVFILAIIRFGLVDAIGHLLIIAILFLLIHEAQQSCRDATYEPSRFPVAVPYPSPHRATPAYVVVTSSDLDTSRNKASVRGLSWISRILFILVVRGPTSAREFLVLSDKSLWTEAYFMTGLYVLAFNVIFIAFYGLYFVTH